MDTASPARLYALVFGAVLTVAGIIGFFYEPSFATGDDLEREAVFGILDVNGWHNVVHLATGLLGLIAAGSLAASRAYALALGVVYIAVAVWGFILGAPDAFVDAVPINAADNWLHLGIGVLGLIAGMAPSRAATAT